MRQRANSTRKNENNDQEITSTVSGSHFLIHSDDQSREDDDWNFWIHGLFWAPVPCKRATCAPFVPKELRLLGVSCASHCLMPGWGGGANNVLGSHAGLTSFSWGHESVVAAEVRRCCLARRMLHVSLLRCLWFWC